MLEAAIPKMMDPTCQTNDDDLARAAAGDPEAFSTLYRRYAVRVYRYLYGKVGSAADAEDLTAQVFTEMIESLPRYRSQGNFAAWIFTIAQRRAADFYRKDRPIVPIEEIDGFPTSGDDPLVQVIASERTQALRQALTSLKEDDLELLRLRFSAGLDYRQLARMLGRNEPAIRMAMHRILRRLEDLLEASHE